MINVNTTVTVM